MSAVPFFVASAMMMASPHQGVVLEFSASWCGPCQRMAPIISKLEREGLPIRSVDVTAERQLAEQYRITNIPAFVLVINGKEADRIVGAATEETVRKLCARIPRAVADAGEPASTKTAKNPPSGYGGPAKTKVPNGPVRVELGEPTEPLRPGGSKPLQLTGIPGRDYVGVDSQPRDAASDSFPAPKTAPGGTASPGSAPKVLPYDSPLYSQGGSKPKGSGSGLGGGATGNGSTGFASGNRTANADGPVARARLSDTGFEAQRDRPGNPARIQGPLAASVRVRVRDRKGETIGSGTIIDSRLGRSIVLTSATVLRSNDAQTTIEIDVFHKATDETFVAEVLACDRNADLGLLTLNNDQPLPVAALAVSGTTVLKGSSLVHTGCNGGEKPTLSATRVVALNRYDGPDTLDCSGIPTQGRNGGGLFSSDGQLVGVYSAPNTEEQCGVFAGLKAIHDMLDDVRRAGNSRTDTADARPGSAPTGGTNSGTSPSPAGKKPVGNDTGARDAGSRDRGTTNLDVDLPALTADEQKALADSLKGGGGEVICVIRLPNGESKVVVIHRASPRFLSYLTDEMEPPSQISRRPTEGDPAWEASIRAARGVLEPSTPTVAPPRPSRNVLSGLADATANGGGSGAAGRQATDWTNLPLIQRATFTAPTRRPVDELIGVRARTRDEVFSVDIDETFGNRFVTPRGTARSEHDATVVPGDVPLQPFNAERAPARGGEVAPRSPATRYPVDSGSAAGSGTSPPREPARQPIGRDSVSAVETEESSTPRPYRRRRD